MKFLSQKGLPVNMYAGNSHAHDDDIFDIDLTVSVLIDGAKNSFLGFDSGILCFAADCDCGFSYAAGGSPHGVAEIVCGLLQTGFLFTLAQSSFSFAFHSNILLIEFSRYAL